MMNTTASSWRKHKSIPITLSEPLQQCSKLDMITYVLIMQYCRYTDKSDIWVTQDKPKINLILTTSDIQKLIHYKMQNFPLKKKKRVLKCISLSLLWYYMCEITLCIALCSISHGRVALSSWVVSVHYKFNLHGNSQQILVRLGNWIRSLLWFLHAI